ncbi:hypothetical protein [Bradyrhizobium sp. RDI18]|uniref:hypothetical protein n=1 Tax=Bradyrhizobium sp. RDI18 TaxID=3367400 RepID=UPI003717AF6D
MIDQKRMIAQLLHMLAELGWTPPNGDVVDLILKGELLSLEQAADVTECSDEKIRKACVAAAATKRPLGINFAGRWFVGRERLLDDIEQGKIDRRRGSEARLRAEQRAKKYESWAHPQAPPKLPERAAG